MSNKHPNKRPLVSIAVPVYNTESYLQRCIDSLINQTLKDIEIILVDDGSTDGSGDICDEYAEKDRRIVVIHKDNGGLASSRQVALQSARGIYLGICDSDDWVELDMFEKLYQQATETGADITMCDFIYEYANVPPKKICYGKELPPDNSGILSELLSGRLSGSMCNKLFRRNVFSNFNLSWDSNINLGEDFMMSLKLFKHPVKMAYLRESLYHYRRRVGEDSYTNRMTLDTYQQMLMIHSWIYENLDTTRYQKGINHHQIDIAFAGLRVGDDMSASYYRQTALNSLSIIDLQRDLTLKAFLIIIAKVLGYRIAKKILKLMYISFYR